MSKNNLNLESIITKIQEMNSRINTLEEEIKLLKGTPTNQLDPKTDSLPIINIPENIHEKLSSMGEPEQIPILWFFSNKDIMTVKEFLEACAKNGFVLSHSWLPSAGGAFSQNFVKKGIFREAKSPDKTKGKHWTFTDVGKFKTSKLISSLK